MASLINTDRNFSNWVIDKKTQKFIKINALEYFNDILDTFYTGSNEKYVNTQIPTDIEIPELYSILMGVDY